MDDHNFIWTITFILVIISQTLFFFVWSEGLLHFVSKIKVPVRKWQEARVSLTLSLALCFLITNLIHNWYWIFLNRILNMNQKEPPTRGQTRRGFAELVAMHGHAGPWSRCRFQISTVVQDPCLMCMASFFSLRFFFYISV